MDGNTVTIGRFRTRYLWKRRKLELRGWGRRRLMNQSTLYGKMTSKFLVDDWCLQIIKTASSSIMSMLSMIPSRYDEQLLEHFLATSFLDVDL